MTIPTSPEVPWFSTTPEAVLRTEGILGAFHAGELERIGSILAQDYTAEGAQPLHTVVALIAMCNRMAEYIAQEREVEHVEVLRETARVVAAAYYQSRDNS